MCAREARDRRLIISLRHIAASGGIMDSLVRWLRRIAPVAPLCFAATTLAAQVASAPNPSQPPNIIASAIGETRITPDRAMLLLAVETQGASAAAAASDNARLQAQVIDAVKATGVPSAQIRTSGYNVSPEYGKAMKVTGYRAHNTVQIEIRNIDAVGKVIDAALGGGATNIGRLSLFSSSTDTARREAVAKAVTKARLEAEAAAVAAGGSLGPLMELTIEPYGFQRAMLEQVVVTGAVMGAPAPTPTPVETGELVVQAVIRAKWGFVPR
jgi:uncharacterized protein YggE